VSPSADGNCRWRNLECGRAPSLKLPWTPRDAGAPINRSPSGYVRNLTDEANVIGAIDFNNLTAFVNEPRMYGVELTKRF
jgi:hypothetical protein